MLNTLTPDKRLYCRYGDKAALCRYYQNSECMNRYACEAHKNRTPGFFNGFAGRCRGFLDRTPSPIAAQRECFWDHSESMARVIYESRAEIRKTLTNNPALICEDCPEFLLPLSFQEKLEPVK